MVLRNVGVKASVTAPPENLPMGVGARENATVQKRKRAKRVTVRIPAPLHQQLTTPFQSARFLSGRIRPGEL